jgi:hypothetical protein
MIFYITLPYTTRWSSHPGLHRPGSKHPTVFLEQASSIKDINMDKIDTKHFQCEQEINMKYGVLSNSDSRECTLRKDGGNGTRSVSYGSEPRVWLKGMTLPGSGVTGGVGWLFQLRVKPGQWTWESVSMHVMGYGWYPFVIVIDEND